jgi:hypothetical protein
MRIVEFITGWFMDVYLRIRRLWQLAASFDEIRMSDRDYLKSLIDKTNDRIGEHVTIHSDVHWKSNYHQIIVIGRWRNRDHVRVFNLESRTWESFVDELHEIEKNSRVGIFDLPPHSEPFSVTYERDRF